MGHLEGGMLNLREVNLLLQLVNIIRVYLRKIEHGSLPLTYVSISSVKVDIERFKQILHMLWFLNPLSFIIFNHQNFIPPHLLNIFNVIIPHIPITINHLFFSRPLEPNEFLLMKDI